MKGITILFLAALATFSVSAQTTIDSVLATIEQNNTTLAAIRKTIDAEKIGNKTGIYLSNPEIEFNYLWGNPSPIGDRTDFSVKQTFDFPTAYSYKKQVAKLKDEQAELEYSKQRMELFHRVRSIYSEIVYLNILKNEYQKRCEHAKSMAGSYKSKFDVGEAGILELNKARVNLLNISKKLENIEIERNAQLSELTLLNGGKEIQISDDEYSGFTVAADFEQWYLQAEQKNPVLQWLKQEIAISEKQAQVNHSLGLPKFHAGYMSEKVVGQQYQGITSGISIPLWENKNAVKYEKAKAEAAAGMETDMKIRFYTEMKNQYQKAMSLQLSTSDYGKQLLELSNSDILKKALDLGQISLSEYLLELSVYYESLDKLLEMKSNAQKAYFELLKYF